jgi:hypothetical protein
MSDLPPSPPSHQLCRRKCRQRRCASDSRPKRASWPARCSSVSFLPRHHLRTAPLLFCLTDPMRHTLFNSPRTTSSCSSSPLPQRRSSYHPEPRRPPIPSRLASLVFPLLSSPTRVCELSSSEGRRPTSTSSRRLISLRVRATTFLFVCRSNRSWLT